MNTRPLAICLVTWCVLTLPACNQDGDRRGTPLSAPQGTGIARIQMEGAWRVTYTEIRELLGPVSGGPSPGFCGTGNEPRLGDPELFVPFPGMVLEFARRMLVDREGRPLLQHLATGSGNSYLNSNDGRTAVFVVRGQVVEGSCTVPTILQIMIGSRTHHEMEGLLRLDRRSPCFGGNLPGDGLYFFRMERMATPSGG